MGAFEQLLATFADEADRKAFEDLGTKNPKIKESVLLRSDYSRRMDEVKDQLGQLNEWNNWRAKHWDEDKKMTKRELEKAAQIEALETEKAQLEEKLLTHNPESEGNEMTFEQLNSWGDKFAKERNIITKTDLDKIIGDKEKELQSFVKTQNQFETYAALVTPELNLRHMKEFGEPFKANEFIKAATDKGQFNLEEFYDNSYVRSKREDKINVDHAAELKRVKDEAEAAVTAAKAEAAAAAQRAANMGPNGLTPTDNEGSLGPMQRKFLKMDEKPPEEGKAPDVPLGEGGLAAFAAKKFLQDQASRVA